MTFEKHWESQRHSMHIHVYDAPNDAFGIFLKQVPVAIQTMTPTYTSNGITFISSRLYFLVYFTSKLVRS